MYCLLFAICSSFILKIIQNHILYTVNPHYRVIHHNLYIINVIYYYISIYTGLFGYSYIRVTLATVSQVVEHTLFVLRMVYLYQMPDSL